MTNNTTKLRKQEARCKGIGTWESGNYAFLYGKFNVNQCKSNVFVHRKIKLAFKRVEFINDPFPYIMEIFLL